MPLDDLDGHDFRVVVLSGPSGSGKTTIVDRLMRDQPVPLTKAISATTRSPRPGEVHGDAYFFMTTEEFQRKIESNEFLEFAEVFGTGNFYGTLRSEVDRARDAGASVLLEIDVQGALRVMEHYPDAISIFLKTPNTGAFEERLRARATETDDVIRRRVETAREELQHADRYRYQIINDDLDRAIAEITHLLHCEMGRANA